MKVFSYLEELLLLFKDLLCKLYIMEFFSTLTLLYMACTFFVLLYFKHLDHYIWYHNIYPRVFLPKEIHLSIFAIKFFMGYLRNKKLEVI
jgi:hypothetical protein